MERQTNNRTDEPELKQLIRKLDRVKAPADMTRRVMARISAGRRDETNRFWIVVARFAVPATLLPLIGGVVWFGFSVRELPLTAVALRESRGPIVPAPAETSPPTSEPSNRATVSVKERREDRTEERKPEPRSVDASIPGSVDRAIRAAEPQLPRASNTSPERIPGFESKTRIPIRSLLYDLGIEAVEENGGLVVKSLLSNGLGERSGVAVGDLIVAIDSRVVGPDTVIERSAKGQTLTVNRAGTRFVLDLK